MMHRSGDIFRHRSGRAMRTADKTGLARGAGTVDRGDSLGPGCSVHRQGNGPGDAALAGRRGGHLRRPDSALHSVAQVPAGAAGCRRSRRHPLAAVAALQHLS